MNTFKKVLAGSLAALTIFSFAGSSLLSPAPARAATIQELQAQVAALLAQIAALTGGSSTSCYTFTTDLTIGSQGEAVRQLQMFLNKKGYTVAVSGAGSAGLESTYFGGLTKAALAKYQFAMGISPAVGYFGPITRARVNADCTVTPNPNPNPNPGGGTLNGGAGSVDEYSLISGLNNEEVGEGQEDVEVAGLEIEVDDGSDIRLTALRLVFDEGTADRRFDRYADEVSVWLDGDEVARLDADEFTKNNNWTKTVSLDSSAIIRRGDTGELTVAVSGISNLDSADEGETWTVDFRQIRFVDAQGASISEDPSTATRTFSFEAFASAANVEMRLALGDEEINEARVIDIDDNGDTDDVEILSFTIEARGDSDLTIDEIPVLLTSAGFNLNDGILGASLWMDGDRIATENLTNASTTETVVFDDLDIEIDAGDKVEFTVAVDLESTSGGLTNGDTIMAEIGSTERNAIDVEDESGEDLSNGDRTGTAAGEAHAVYDEGIMVEFVSATQTETFTADDTGEFDQGTFEIRFRVTAFDGDMRIDRSCEEDGGDVAGQGIEYSITNSGSNSTVCTLTSASSDSEDTANTFEVDEGETRTFTLTVVATASSTAFAEVALESINWGTQTDDTNANYYTFNLDDFKTGALNLAAL